MKKSTLCYCFTWIVFIELNFRVAFLLIRETWDDGFASKMKGGGGWGILRKGGDRSNGEGVDTPSQTMSARVSFCRPLFSEFFLPTKCKFYW